MKKFECKECSGNCRLEIEEVGELRLKCVRHYDGIVKWHEVKEENTQVHTQVKLPDWVKVGKWVYCPTTGNYGEVVDQQGNTVLLRPFGSDDDTVFSKDINIILERGKPAKKRPFNEKEMRELVGKVLETPHIDLLVNAYSKVTKGVSTAWRDYTAEDLMDLDFTIDGKPCYKLEHLENGEWVE